MLLFTDLHHKKDRSRFASLTFVALCLIVLSHDAYSLFLAATANEESQPTSGYKKTAPTYTSATKTENGVSYEYSMDNGVERLRVLGHLAPSFDADTVMQEFRDALGLKQPSMPADTCRDQVNTPRQADDKAEKPKSLLESFSEYFVGSKFGFDVQKYYEAFTSRESAEQIELARNELIVVEDDLSKVQTQKLILSKRQSELGTWIREDLKKPIEERNPTVEELVNNESDRLALLEHRLQRLENKLVSQKNEIMGYLRMQDRAKIREVYEKLDEDTHIFTRKSNAGCSATPSPVTIIPDLEDYP